MICIPRVTPDTAAIFSTFPGPHLSSPWVGGAGDQLLATMLLTIAICSVTDTAKFSLASSSSSSSSSSVVTIPPPSSLPPSALVPGVSGLAVLGLGLSLGYNCGYPLNPARDLAPRLLMGNTTTSHYHTYITHVVSVSIGMDGY